MRTQFEPETGRRGRPIPPLPPIRRRRLEIFRWDESAAPRHRPTGGRPRRGKGQRPESTSAVRAGDRSPKATNPTPSAIYRPRMMVDCHPCVARRGKSCVVSRLRRVDVRPRSRGGATHPASPCGNPLVRPHFRVASAPPTQAHARLIEGAVSCLRPTGGKPYLPK